MAIGGVDPAIGLARCAEAGGLPADSAGSAGSADRQLDAPALRRLPDPGLTPASCACQRLQCRGWESIPQPLGAPLLRCLGTLRPPGDDDPTLDEWPGSRYWAADAPISPRHFPYNRCAVWACAACGQGFLQYTEFGGYYVDHRLRRIDPALVVSPAG